MEKKKCIIFIPIGALVFLVSYTATKYINKLPQISMEGLRSYVLSYGSFSSVIFLVLYTLKPVIIFLPTVLLSIVAGSIYEPITATALNLIGCLLSATAAFCIAKIVGRSFVEKIFGGRLIKLDKNLERDGFKIILIMRLSIIFPFDALSYAAGLTSIRYWDFISSTILGILPEMIAYSLAGGNLQRPLSIRFILPFILIGFCAVTFSYIFNFTKEKG